MEPAPAAPLGPGDFVNANLRLVKSIGAGGMGSVWLADHLTLHTQVVVKFLAAAMATDEVLRSRFSHEAAAASQVKSPHVVQMIDHGVAPNGLPFIAMEHLEGETLAEHLRRVKVLPPQTVVAIVQQIAKALTRAQARGIVHRDIKPDNVFLCDAHEGEIFVKVLDFGIAKRPEQESGSTQTGQALGTPSFMSPEQTIGSKDVDHRSDLWSLGVLAFLLLTGTKPFAGGSIGAVALAVHTKVHPKPTERNPELPPAIDTWFAKACAVEVEDRFQSARELADSLAEALGVSTTGPRSITAEVSSFTKLKLDTVPPQETNHGPIAQTIQPDTLPAPAPPKRRIALALLALGVVAVFVVVWQLRSRNQPGEASAASATASSGVSTASTAAAPPASASAVKPPVEPPAPVASSSAATSASTSAAASATTTAAGTAVTAPKTGATTAPAKPAKPIAKTGDDDIE